MKKMNKIEKIDEDPADVQVGAGMKEQLLKAMASINTTLLIKEGSSDDFGEVVEEGVEDIKKYIDEYIEEEDVNIVEIVIALFETVVKYHEKSYESDENYRKPFDIIYELMTRNIKDTYVRDHYRDDPAIR